MSEKTMEADLMKLFFNIGSILIRDSTISCTDIDSMSLVASCHIGVNGKKNCGAVRNSILCNVRCRYVDADGCILINVTADSIIARPGSIIYNIADESECGLDLSEGQVLTGVFANDGSQTVMRSATEIDGGKAWSEHLEWNPKTFEDVYNNNTNADPIALERIIADKHKQQWGQYSTTSEALSNYVQDIDAIEKRERAYFWMGVTTGVLGIFAAVGLSSALVLLPRMSASSK